MASARRIEVDKDAVYIGPASDSRAIDIKPGAIVILYGEGMSGAEAVDAVGKLLAAKGGEA